MSQTSYALKKEASLKACSQNIISTLKLADQMIQLADRGDAQREDTGCGICHSSFDYV